MNLFDLVAKITLDTSEYDKGLNNAEKTAQTGGGGIGKALGTAAKVGAAAITAASTAVAGFAASSIKAGSDFDSAMAQVAATSGVTMDELKENIVTVDGFSGSLRDFAQYMGSTTAFSATQSAEALNYMALAGYDATKSVQMLPNVMNLAAAGGMELASASDMVTDAQTALGLSTRQTEILVDQMAMASSKSNTSVAQLGDAILTVGGNAKNLAGGTRELTTILGVMADNGIKGSEAGTHLRNIMLAMTPTTEKAAGAWEALGVSAYTADGELRPLQEIFVELNEAMADMTDEAKTDMINSMFNKTDLAAVNALLDTTQNRYEGLAGSIQKSQGAAQRMAETQLDNLAGDITLFQSALEGAKIKISDVLMPSLREFVQFGSDGVSKLGQAFQARGFEGAMNAFGGILRDGLAMVVDMLPQFIESGVQLIGALGKGIIQNLPALADAVMQIIPMLANVVMTGVPQLLQTGTKMIQSVSEGARTGMSEFLSQALPMIMEFTGELLSNADQFIQAGIELITNLALGFIDAIPVMIETIPTIVSNIANIINDNAPKVLEAGIKLIIALGMGLIQAIPTLIANIPEIINAIVNVFMAFNWLNMGTKIITGIKNGITAAKSFLTSGMKATWSDALAYVKNLPSVFQEMGHNIIQGLINGVKAAGSALKGALSDIIGAGISAAKEALGIKSPSRVFKYMGEMCVEGFELGIQDLADGTIMSNAIGGAELAIRNESRAMAASAPMENNVTVVLEGDADRLFRVVQRKSNTYTRLTGQPAFN